MEESKSTPSISHDDAHSDSNTLPIPVSYDGENHHNHASYVHRIIDSFKRDPSQLAAHKLKEDESDKSSFDVESAIVNTSKSPLARKLKSRHLQMIAIGGAIGGSFLSLSSSSSFFLQKKFQF